MMIENQLLEQGILTEGMPSEDGPEFGPPAQLVPVSGMTGEGLNDLIEGLVLQSEVMDLRADEEARAEGVVMDARVDKGLGIVADCIVRWGKLERGDYVVSGVHGGKVRILSDVSGAPLQKARPSQPVRIVGLKSLPKAGDPIISVQSEEIAKELVERRVVLASSEGASVAFRADSTSGPELQVTGMASKQGSMLQKVLDKYGMGDEDTDETIRIPVVIKADADGSLEAVRDAMLAIGADSKRDIVIDPICLGVGAPTTTDVTMAKESGASVFCFGLKGTSDKAAASLAEAEGVSIVSNDVIYTLLDEAKDLFAAHLPPVPVEKVHGSAEVKAVYDINNKKDAERIAGLQVSEGQLFLDKTISTGDGTTLTCHYRILRNGKLVSDKSEMLRAKSLRRFKEEVTDVRRGDECGLGLGFEDIQEGDTIECYSVEMKSFFI
jgi:translation initiation factor IF-2